MSEDRPLDRNEVLTRLRPRVLAAARAGVPPEDAEEIAQETLLLLSTKYEHVAAPEELVRIAVGIVFRKRKAYWRKHARRARLGHAPLPPQDPGSSSDPIEDAAGALPDPEAVVTARQRVSLLAEAMSALGERCRHILRRKLEGLTAVEIAAELGRPVNTIYSWDHRCHERLRKRLGDRWAFVAGREDA